MLAQAQPLQETQPPQSLDLLKILMDGGWAMYPLAACSLAMLFLVFYGFRETRKSQFCHMGRIRELSGFFEQGDWQRARQCASTDSTVLGRLMTQVSLKIPDQTMDRFGGHAGDEWGQVDKSSLETTLVETMEYEENQLSQWVNYLNVVAAIAPMVGLLGTVSGMIGAFQTIGSGGMGNPELLAGSIGEALITTAAGLVIGIPAMVLYFVLRNRLASRVIETMRMATLLVDQISGEVRDMQSALLAFAPSAD